MLSPCAKGETSKHVKQIVLTGIYNTLLKEAGSGVNNIIEYGITDEKYSEFFGFSEEELKEQVFRLAFEGDTSNVLSTLREWYNGQMIGRKTAFTPSSVMRYISDLKVQY